MLNLKKLFKLLLPAALALSFSNLAMAEIHPGSVEQALSNPEISSQWPYPAKCIATDVNVRTQPNTNCNVITMLQPEDKFYITKVIPKADYTWMEGYLADGRKGYMVSKFLDPAPNAASRRERFRAAFNLATTYNPSVFAAACGTIFTNQFEVVEPEVFHYMPHRVKVGPNWVHGESFPDGFDCMAVIVTAPGYNVVGYQVGDRFTVKEAITMNRDLMYIGWDDAEGLKEKNEYYWYRSEAVDGHERPVEGFTIYTKNQIITEIRWHKIVID